MKRVLFSLIAMMATLGSVASEPFVVFQTSADVLSLQDASVSFDTREHSCVQRAIANLQKDFEKVTQKQLPLSENARILVGTVGVNKQIDQWVKKGVLRDLKGKTEKYIIKTIGDQLVIAGSDKRGTVYGIYELTQQMGVSPWYYWADVPIKKHEALYIKKGEYTDGEPAVRYRGLFLNDEAPCLTTWVKNTFGTDYGDHCFYEQVFELILRLKGNFLWPAMWGWAFYADDPENSKVADEMGIIMGTSHHEPMARNHQEYARHRKDWGAWNYETNKENLDRFFREGIERMKGTDDIVTIGMRGDGDEAMSANADTKLLENIIDNQRRIIKEVTGKPAEKTTQVWALYKEVQDYYDAGLRVPDDVMILISDDNWGDIRRVPTAAERKRKGGWGIYYHVDYVGAPRNTKWLNVTQTQQMFEQLSLAYDFGIERMWILNVGDLKPMEYPITLFMDMAWRPKDYTVQTVTDHTRNFFRSVFCNCVAEEAADIYNQNCQYMARVTPEMLDARTYNVETGEWKQVADDYQRLELRALRLYEKVPAEARDFYRQLILFPVQAMANLYDMYYAQAMNQYLAASKAYLSGLHGLKADVKPFPTGEIDRHTNPPADEDLTVIFRTELNEDDFIITGQKAVAEMPRTEGGRMKVIIWNLSDTTKTGTVNADGGEFSGIPQTITIPPMGKTEFETVFKPILPNGVFESHIVFSGVFNGKKTSKLAIPVHFIGLFLQNCRQIPMNWMKPSDWEKNTSATSQECVFDEVENALRFDVAWNTHVDRWFYPVHTLKQPEESFKDVQGIQFEVKTAQNKVENDFNCSYVMVAYTTPDDASTRVINFSYTSPLTTWEVRRIMFDKTIPADATVKFLRFGCNPRGTQMTYWLKNIKYLSAK